MVTILPRCYLCKYTVCFEKESWYCLLQLQAWELGSSAGCCELPPRNLCPRARAHSHHKLRAAPLQGSVQLKTRGTLNGGSWPQLESGGAMARTGDPFPADSFLATAGSSLHLLRHQPPPDSGGGDPQFSELLVTHSAPIGAARWNRNNKVVAAGSADGSLQLLYAGGTVMGVLPRDGTSHSSLGPITSLSWSVGSKRLAAGSGNGSVYIHDIQAKVGDAAAASCQGAGWLRTGPASAPSEAVPTQPAAVCMQLCPFTALAVEMEPAIALQEVTYHALLPMQCACTAVLTAVPCRVLPS